MPCLMPWPPHSPDVTPLDFFLWGYVEIQDFTVEVKSVDEVKRSTTQAHRCNADKHVRRNSKEVGKT
mgnify:CR=1 FL=1